MTKEKETRLDRGLIRSSPKYGLSTPWTGLSHHFLIYMGDLHFFLPLLNLNTLDASILIMVQQVRMMMFSQNVLEYFMSFLSLST